MSNRLGGKQGTAYLGTNANQPPNITFNNNDPTQYDSQNVSLGDFWLNTNTEGLWVLVSLAGNSTSKGVLATWVLISTGGIGDVQTLTGDNNTVHVPPTAGNINIIGTANNVTVTGNAGTSTLTINTGAHVATTYTEDSGSAAPAAGNLNVLGGTAGRDINTSGAGSTIHIDLNNAITLGDLSAIAGGSNALSCTTGDINIAAGNLKLPNTASTGNSGQIQLNATRFVHNYGVNNTFIGSSAGNLTLTVGSAQGCTGIGTSALNAQTTGSSNTALGYNCLILCDAGSNNTGFGALTLNNLTSGNQNCGIGQGSLSLLTTASQNCAVGNNSLSNIGTGANNIAVGFNAGSNNTTNDSNNIFIGNSGTIGDNNKIRIGTNGTGAGQQNQTFLLGGNVSKPNSCAFMAFINATVNNVTGDGTNYTPIFNTAAFDQTSSYNTGTGVFTAPVTGKYFFSTNMVLSNSGTATGCALTIVTSASGNFAAAQGNPTNMQDASGLTGMSITGFVSLTAGDTVNISIRASGTGKTVGVVGNNTNPVSYFGGWLVA